MKLVRTKSGEVEFIPDNVSTQDEVIWHSAPKLVMTSYDTTVSEEAKDKGAGGDKVGSPTKPPGFFQHADIVDGKNTGDIEVFTVDKNDKDELGTRKGELGTFVGTAAERKKFGYDPDKKLLTDIKRYGGKSESKIPGGGRVCALPGCTNIIPGTARSNKITCSNKCRVALSTLNAKKREAERKAIEDFKPSFGAEGQIYYMTKSVTVDDPHKHGASVEVKGHVDFIPALWTDTWKRTNQYVKTHFPEELQTDIMAQVETVLPKSGKGRTPDKTRPQNKKEFLAQGAIRQGLEPIPKQKDIPDRDFDKVIVDKGDSEWQIELNKKKVPISEIKTILAKNNYNRDIQSIKKKYKLSYADAKKALDEIGKEELLY